MKRSQNTMCSYAKHAQVDSREHRILSIFNYGRHARGKYVVGLSVGLYISDWSDSTVVQKAKADEK